MALFFDNEWFDGRLAERELDRATLAAIVGWSAEDLALAFKDQREISPAEVQAIAALLNAPVEEVARRCGTSTRSHPKDDVAARLDAIEARLARLEQKLD